MTYLLLNRRRILTDMPTWFPDSADELVVFTARGAARPGEVEALRPRVRHLEVVDDYEGVAADERIRELAKEFGVEAVLLTAEIDVLRAARLREELDLPGQRTASATAYRDKHVMKSHAAAAGLTVAAMRPIGHTGDLVAFAAEHGFPVVVKRTAGAASLGMRVVEDQAALTELISTWRDGPPEPMLAERWIEGDLFHVDGVMRAGEVLLSWPSRYLHTQWASASRSANELGGMLARSDPLFERLRHHTAQVIAALPPAPEELPFHAEFFHTPDDEIVLCEIACRPGGGEIVAMFEHAFGFNLYEAALKGQAGRYAEIGVRAEPRRHGWGWLPRRRGTLEEIPASAPFPSVCWYTATGEVGAWYEAPRSMADIIARMVFTVDGADVVPELELLDEWWKSAVRWRTDADR
ncbi:ATP-grasp domain-containing protein [Lentzea sp. NPDC004789]